MAADNVESLRHMVSTIHGDVHQLRRSVDDVKDKVDTIQLQLAEQKGEQTASKKLREKLEELPELHNKLKLDVEVVKVDVETVKTQQSKQLDIVQKLAESQQLLDRKEKKPSATVQLVESEHGRKVIYWVLTTCIICTLAFSGGIATQDVRGLMSLWLGVAPVVNQGPTTGVTAVPPKPTFPLPDQPEMD